MTLEEIGTAFMKREPVEIQYDGTWIPVLLMKMNTCIQPHSNKLFVEWYAIDTALAGSFDIDMRCPGDMIRKRERYRIVWSL
jgi:hypothetical protein